MSNSKNSTCLFKLKQAQEELYSVSDVTCGLNEIRTEDECQNFTIQNTQFYSTNGSITRLQNCQNYFEIFQTAGTKPVSTASNKKCTYVLHYVFYHVSDYKNGASKSNSILNISP